jgi:hypothetical protein
VALQNKLIRELQRKLPTHSLFETYQKDFLFSACLMGLFLFLLAWLMATVKVFES